MTRVAALTLAFLATLPFALSGCVRSPAVPVSPQEVIVDTDIGDDIDDAFALALVLRSPVLRLDAVSASFGDTTLRARLLEHLLAVAGRSDVPVLVGPRTGSTVPFTQSGFATDGPDRGTPYPDAVDGILQRLRAAPPGTITLIGLAPLTTVAAMIVRDPDAFHRLRQVVMMGGWIRRGYPPLAGGQANPEPEYNVASDPAGLRALLASGVPVQVMPLDATMVPLRTEDRAVMFDDVGLGPTLRTLFEQWHRGSPYPGHPTLFDVVPVAWLLQPSICSPEPMHLAVLQNGLTIPGEGVPNASVCLTVDASAVQALLVEALNQR